MSKKTALGYVRVSTKQQVDKFGYPAQRKMIEEYAEEKDIEIVAWFEEAYTGAEQDRPEMTAILNGQYKVDYLIVAKTDRFSRDITYYYALKLQLMRLGITLVSAFEDFGQMGIYQPLMEAMTASFAEIERQMINQRTAGGREIKRKTGGYCGGHTPYGYDTNNGRLIINRREARTVRTIFEMRKSGMSYRKICDKLEELNITTAQGRKFAPSSIKVILDNEPTYKGLYRYGNDEWVQGQHEPILD